MTDDVFVGQLYIRSNFSKAKKSEDFFCFLLLLMKLVFAVIKLKFTAFHVNSASVHVYQ